MSSPPYALNPVPMKKSWIERHPLWKIPLGCLTLLVLLAAFGTIMIAIITGSFRTSDVYKQAMLQAAGNPQVRAEIGEPIQAGWFVSGQLRVSGTTGNANMSIPISGNRGQGLIRLVARKNQVWRFSCLQVDVAGPSHSIDLLPSVPEPNRAF